MSVSDSALLCHVPTSGPLRVLCPWPGRLWSGQCRGEECTGASQPSGWRRVDSGEGTSVPGGQRPQPRAPWSHPGANFPDPHPGPALPDPPTRQVPRLQAGLPPPPRSHPSLPTWVPPSLQGRPADPLTLTCDLPQLLSSPSSLTWG